MSSIETDGIAVSFIQSRMDLTKYKVTAKEVKDKEKYIDDPSINPSEFQDMTLAAADPGKSDLLYFSANLATGMTHSNKPERDKQVHFRYTQNQRTFESKSSKFQRERDSIRNDTLITIRNSTGRVIDLSNYEPSEEQQQRMDLNSSIINQMTERTISLLRGEVPQEINIPHKINRSFNLRNNDHTTKSVAEWEATLSQFNSKSCRSEAKMIRRFESVIGDPGQVVIGIGNWEQRKHMKFKEPTKGKSLRILFKKADYKVFLIDEFRSSCCCFNCKKAEKTVETFRWCRNPRPWNRHEMSIRHGLTMCKSCESLWNRDRNAPLNMLAMMEAHVNGGERPQCLQRDKVDKGSKKKVSRRKSSQKLSLNISVKRTLILLLLSSSVTMASPLSERRPTLKRLSSSLPTYPYTCPSLNTQTSFTTTVPSPKKMKHDDMPFSQVSYFPITNPKPDTPDSYLPRNHRVIVANGRKLYTEEDVQTILNNALGQLEEGLKKKYDKILAEKLQDQYNCFVTFNKEYLSRNVEPGQMSYYA
ncbi:hypothetical protein P9112_005163 [Eukaryota sp. TZLM1-RC]